MSGVVPPTRRRQDHVVDLEALRVSRSADSIAGPTAGEIGATSTTMYSIRTIGGERTAKRTANATLEGTDHAAEVHSDKIGMKGTITTGVGIGITTTDDVDVVAAGTDTMMIAATAPEDRNTCGIFTAFNCAARNAFNSKTLTCCKEPAFDFTDVLLFTPT